MFRTPNLYRRTHLWAAACFNRLMIKLNRVNTDISTKLNVISWTAANTDSTASNREVIKLCWSDLFPAGRCRWAALDRPVCAGLPPVLPAPSPPSRRPHRQAPEIWEPPGTYGGWSREEEQGTGTFQITLNRTSVIKVYILDQMNHIDRLEKRDHRHLCSDWTTVTVTQSSVGGVSAALTQPAVLHWKCQRPDEGSEVSGSRREALFLSARRSLGWRTPAEDRRLVPACCAERRQPQNRKSKIRMTAVGPPDSVLLLCVLSEWLKHVTFRCLTSISGMTSEESALLLTVVSLANM